jgi:lysophospholipase L1-like esterase
MATKELPPGVRTAIEFKTYEVPAELGIAMPAQAASCVLNIEVEQYNAHLAQIEAALRADATRLAARPEMAAAVRRLPIPDGGLVLVVGDSVSAYRRSYAELLRVLFGLCRPDSHIRLVNRAQSGYTSTHALRATYRQYVLEKPDLVFVLLGGNDCERFAGGPPLLSFGEYRDNIEAIVAAFRARTQAQVVLLSPVPVIDKLWRQVPDHRRLKVSWDNNDLQVFADALRSLALQYNLAFVDLMEAFGTEPDAGLYFVDGLHPGPRGEELILRRVLEMLG